LVLGEPILSQAHSQVYVLVLVAFWNKYSIVSILVYCTTINNLEKSYCSIKFQTRFLQHFPKKGNW